MLDKTRLFLLTKAIEEKQELLKSCILKGCCPHCLSKKIEYREFLTNQRFGFKCQKCSWHNEFSVEELMQFAHRFI